MCGRVKPFRRMPGGLAIDGLLVEIEHTAITS
jgi:hypothetical protein